MEWQEEGLVLGVRKHGETSAIVELMTEAHGRHLGLVRGGRSKRMRPVLQAGNLVRATWQARLEEHLGTFVIEPVVQHAAELMANQIALFGMQTLASHLRLLPERDPHANLYRAAKVMIENLKYSEIAASLMVRFELVLLDELGFGLDLTCCASNGGTEGLVYVSPRSGHAVSESAGRPWADKMLPLPAFLNRYEADWGRIPKTDQLKKGFDLSGFFFDRYIYVPRRITPPNERASFIRIVSKPET